MLVKRPLTPSLCDTHRPQCVNIMQINFLRQGILTFERYGLCVSTTQDATDRIETDFGNFDMVVIGIILCLEVLLWCWCSCLEWRLENRKWIITGKVSLPEEGLWGREPWSRKKQQKREDYIQLHSYIYQLAALLYDVGSVFLHHI